MQVGELYDPWDVFQGAYMPLVIASQKDLSSNSKVVWSMLHYCGRDSSPSQEELAELCGIPLRTIGRCLAELHSKGFIRPVGKRDRCIVWGFIWHPSFEGARLRKRPTSLEATLPRWQTPERATLPNRQTTTETEPAKMAEDAKEPNSEVLAAEKALDSALMSAKLAEDSLPKWQRIVCQICRLRAGYRISCEFFSEKEGKNLTPPPGTSPSNPPTPTASTHIASSGGSSDSPSAPGAPRGSPDPELMELIELARRSIPAHKLDDRTLAVFLNDWRAKYGVHLVDVALEVAKDHQGPIGNWVAFVRGTIEKKRKDAQNDAGSSRARSYVRSGL